MRTKRAQRHQRASRKAAKSEAVVLPDPFSRSFPKLVEKEEDAHRDFTDTPKLMSHGSRIVATWALRTDIDQLVWSGDTDALNENYPCRCCCDEHTFEDCPARAWWGCRGQGTPTRAEENAWRTHYAIFHGMSDAVYYGDGG